MVRPKKNITAKQGKKLCQLRVPVNWYVQFCRHSTKTGRFMQELYIEALEKIIGAAETAENQYPFRAAFSGDIFKTYNLWIPKPLYDRLKALSDEQNISQTAIIWTALTEAINYEVKKRVKRQSTEEPEKAEEV